MGSAGTFDWGGYFNTQYFADPEEKIIGIIMKQTQGPTSDQTGWKFRQLVGAMVDD
jgi:CubicO group peptidase (beta-lactamase class C family)